MEKKVYNNFEFVSKLDMPKETDKFKVYKHNVFDSGWIKDDLNLNAKIKDSAVIVSVSDGYFDKKGYKLKKTGIGNKKEDGSWERGSELEISWSDRNNKSIIEKVSPGQRYVFDLSNNKERYELRHRIELIEKEGVSQVDKDKALQELEDTFKTKDLDKLKEKLQELEDMKHEFLSRVDMIETLKKELPKHKDMIFKTTGNLTFSEWNGKVYRNFEVKKIEKALDIDKEMLKADIDLYFNSESLDESMFEDTKKYIINAYTKSYDSQLKKEIFLPITLVMDASRLDLENKIHKGKVDFLINPFRVEDNNKYYQLQYNVKITRGAEKKEITIDDLTEFQRNQVEVGLTSLEKIRKELGGNKFGDRVDEIRLININTKDFQNGAEETDLTIDDFIIDKSDNEETKDKVNNEENKNTESNTQEEDLDDLI